MSNWQAWKHRAAAAAFAALSAAPAWAVDPVVTITATPDPAVAGSSVSLSVLVSGITDLFAFQYSLSFNPSILQATGTTEGNFLTPGGFTLFNGGTINNTAGTIAFTYDTLIGNVAGVSGSGLLATVNFNAIAGGSSALSFSNVAFYDSALMPITVQATDRTLQVSAIPEPAPLAMLALGLAAVGLVRRRRADAA